MKFAKALTTLFAIGFASNALAFSSGQSAVALAEDALVARDDVTIEARKELALEIPAEVEVDAREETALDLPGEVSIDARNEIVTLDARVTPVGAADDAVFHELLPHAQSTRVGKTGSVGVGIAAKLDDGSIITGHSQGGGVHAEDDVIQQASQLGKTITHVLPFGNNSRRPTADDKVVPPCKAQCEGKVNAAGISALGRTEASKFNKAHGLPTTLTKPTI